MTRSHWDREQPPEAGAPSPDISTILVRPAPTDSRLPLAFVAVALLVLVAALKPWGAGSPEPTSQPVAVSASAIPVTPAPTEDRSAEGLATGICLGAGAWQIASLESWRTQDVRVWRAVEPIGDARGPDDPTIPSVPVVALHVPALGWCAPAFGPDRPDGPATVTAWYVRDAVVTDMLLEQVRPADGVTQLGALYVPLTTCPEQTICAPLLRDPVPGPWATGRVVFRYVDGATGSAAWFAADVTILPAPAVPEATPSTAP